MPRGRVDLRQLQALMPGVPEAAIEELAATARPATHAPGQTVVAGGLVPGLVTDGAAALVVTAADGREAMLRTVGRGGMFGLFAMFDAERGTVAAERRIVALQRTSVVLFDGATMVRLAQRHAGLAVQAARHLANSTSAVTDTAGQFAFMTVRQRLAGHLLGIATRDADGNMVASATQQQLASSIGTVREVVARTLHDLREEGLIEVSRGRVAIVKPDELADSAAA